MSGSLRSHAPRVAAVLAALSIATAAAAEDTVLRIAASANLRSLDPIASAGVVTNSHGNMVYDTLFALDVDGNVQPQMVGSWSLSEDELTYHFTLREGLAFHDGSPVTSADVIASLRRWMSRDRAGQMIEAITVSLEPDGDDAFRWVLEEPFGILLDSLAKPISVVPFIMREEEASTPPTDAIPAVIGSGPFVFDAAAWQPGAVAIYRRNQNYVPREEPASGFAGARTPGVDVVEVVWIPDPQTRASALMTGEVHIIEDIPPEIIPLVEGAQGVSLIGGESTGTQAQVVINHLHPPFDEPAMREAILRLVDLEGILRAWSPDPAHRTTCASFFGCGTTMSTDAGIDGFGAADPEAAGALIAEAGYDGEPISILIASDEPEITLVGEVFLSQLRREPRLNLEPERMSWASLTSRRQSKDPVADGGWNLFVTTTGLLAAANPIFNLPTRMCDAAWFGWPCDAEAAQLQREWASTADPESRRAIAAKLQERYFENVTYIPIGQTRTFNAYRSDLIDGFLGDAPWLPPYWNVTLKD